MLRRWREMYRLRIAGAVLHRLEREGCTWDEREKRRWEFMLWCCERELAGEGGFLCVVWTGWETCARRDWEAWCC